MSIKYVFSDSCTRIYSFENAECGDRSFGSDAIDHEGTVLIGIPMSSSNRISSSQLECNISQQTKTNTSPATTSNSE